MTKGYLISYALTTPQIIDMSKTVTRRKNWERAKAGVRLQPVDRVMGFKKGEHPQLLIPGWHQIVVSARWEALEDITPEDVEREGFVGWTTEQFISFYCKHNKGDRKQQVRRIEFRYERDEEMPMFSDSIPGEKSTPEQRKKQAEGERPATIKAAQWDTVAADVKAGKVKAYWNPEQWLVKNVVLFGDSAAECVFHCYGDDVPISIDRNEVFTLEWQQPTEPAPDKYQSMVKAIGERVSDPTFASWYSEYAKNDILDLLDTCDARASEIKRLQSELTAANELADDLQGAVSRAIFLLGIDSSDWSQGIAGIEAAVKSNLRIGTKGLETREAWCDDDFNLEGTITERLFELVGQVGKLREVLGLWPSRLTQIEEVAWDSQGEWAAVDAAYAPGWAQGYKEILAEIEEHKRFREQDGLKALDEGKGKS